MQNTPAATASASLLPLSPDKTREIFAKLAMVVAELESGSFNGRGVPLNKVYATSARDPDRISILEGEMRYRLLFNAGQRGVFLISLERKAETGRTWELVPLTKELCPFEVQPHEKFFRGEVGVVEFGNGYHLALRGVTVTNLTGRDWISPNCNLLTRPYANEPVGAAFKRFKDEFNKGTGVPLNLAKPHGVDLGDIRIDGDVAVITVRGLNISGEMRSKYFPAASSVFFNMTYGPFHRDAERKDFSPLAPPTPALHIQTVHRPPTGNRYGDKGHQVFRVPKDDYLNDRVHLRIENINERA